METMITYMSHSHLLQSVHLHLTCSFCYDFAHSFACIALVVCSPSLPLILRFKHADSRPVFHLVDLTFIHTRSMFTMIIVVLMSRTCTYAHDYLDYHTSQDMAPRAGLFLSLFLFPITFFRLFACANMFTFLSRCTMISPRSSLCRPFT